MGQRRNIQFIGIGGTGLAKVARIRKVFMHHIQTTGKTLEKNSKRAQKKDR